MELYIPKFFVFSILVYLDQLDHLFVNLLVVQKLLSEILEIQIHLNIFLGIQDQEH